jgi:hypothetical protein
MNKDEVDEWGRENEEQLLLFDGFDEAIIGVGIQFSNQPVVIYSQAKIIQILIDDGATHEEAHDHYGFNIAGSWVGNQTPMILQDIDY